MSCFVLKFLGLFGLLVVGLADELDDCDDMEETPKPDVKEVETPKPDVKEVETPKPEVKEEETPKPEVKQEDHLEVIFPDHPTQPSYMTPADGVIPDMNDFTLCFWVNPTTVEKEFAVFSYATPKVSHELLFVLMKDQEAAVLFVHGVATTIKAPKLKNAWQHYCVLFEHSTGKVTLVADGGQKWIQNFHRQDLKKFSKVAVNGKGKVVIGQFQKKYNDANYHKHYSFKGTIRELQLWSRLLTDAEVTNQLLCTPPEGDVISWEKTKWKFVNGAKKAKGGVAHCKSVESPN